MIERQWYVVLESSQVGKKAAGFMRMGERMIFWRDDSGKVSCHVDKCAHRGASFAQGEVLHGTAPAGTASRGTGGRLKCPFHGIEYDSSGRATVIPANGRAAPVPEGYRLKTYPTHEERGFIWIWWGELTSGEAVPAAPRFFDDIPERLSWSTRQDPWDNHYSRSIENQLDMAHLPFIHRTTIGRGGKTVVDGPGIFFNEGGFLVRTFNRLDDGSPAKSVAEASSPELILSGRLRTGQKLEFIFPNLWQNYITEKLRILAAFVPVDAQQTIMYLRFYQGFTRLPLLKNLVHAVGDAMNLVIAHQDRRVVNTQLPKAAGEAACELLFPGDAAIMEYRKMRVQAKKKAAAPGAGGDS